jgi:putative phosphoesterase
MRILVISDTHIPAHADRLPRVIQKEAQQSDCCLHCGDFTSIAVYKTLSSWTTTHGVCGNMDEPALRKELPQKRIIRFEGVTLALTHGGGHPQNLIAYVQKEFQNDAATIDIFVFGHSHCATNEEHEGKVYFNPGSPTDTMFATERSYGILTINGDTIERRIVPLG